MPSPSLKTTIPTKLTTNIHNRKCLPFPYTRRAATQNHEKPVILQVSELVNCWVGFKITNVAYQINQHHTTEATVLPFPGPPPRHLFQLVPGYVFYWLFDIMAWCNILVKQFRIELDKVSNCPGSGLSKRVFSVSHWNVCPIACQSCS